MNLDDLPVEIIYYIFKFIPVNNALSIFLVSKKIHDIFCLKVENDFKNESKKISSLADKRNNYDCTTEKNCEIKGMCKDVVPILARELIFHFSCNSTIKYANGLINLGIDNFKWKLDMIHKEKNRFNPS